MDFKEETVDILYNEVRETLNRQFESITALNTKLADIMKMSLFMIAVVLLTTENSIISGVSLVLLWDAFLISLLGYRNGTYKRDQDPILLREKYITQDTSLKTHIIDSVIDSYSENKIKIERKAKHIDHSLLFIGLGMLMALFSLL